MTQSVIISVEFVRQNNKGCYLDVLSIIMRTKKTVDLTPCLYNSKKGSSTSYISSTVWIEGPGTIQSESIYRDYSVPV